MGERDPSVMIIRRAQIEPPTQNYSVERDRREAAVDLVVFECHSNIEKPGLVASFSPQRGSFLIDPLSA